jgi:hypothetical protein
MAIGMNFQDPGRSSDDLERSGNRFAGSFEKQQERPIVLASEKLFNEGINDGRKHSR